MNLRARLLLFFCLAASLGSPWPLLNAAEKEAPLIRINEIMAINATGLEDRDDDHPDWIELYYGGEESLSLEGWSLTDDPEKLRKWAFPNFSAINPAQLLILFASGKNVNSLFSGEYHTNFSLSGGGGYLAIVDPDGNIVHELVDYPPQTRDVSYGLVEDRLGEFGVLASSTPRHPNAKASTGHVSHVQFSVGRGVFDAPFTLELHTDTPEARILYSTSGAAPNLFTASTYTEPILIDGTTIIRAVAHKADFLSSPIATHTYIFPEDVLDQSKMRTRITGDPESRRRLLETLHELDTLSIVRNKNSGTISMGREEGVSVELLPADGTPGFQIDSGIKRVGGASINHPKNNMRLYFSSEFGPSKLKYPLYESHAYTKEAAEEFDRLQLHGGSHDSVYYNANQALYFRNRWMNDTHFAMGQPSLRGRWVHVFIHGAYWGFYNLTERPHPSYFQAYYGGHEDDYMATNRGQAVGSSNMKPWRDMIPTARDYPEFQRRVDVANFIDYMILNLYAGNQDWNPRHNWMAGGPIEPDAGGFKFFSWDSDLTLRDPIVNLVNAPGPESLFTTLKGHADFRVLLGDRLHKHLFNGGALTPEESIARLDHRAAEIESAVVAESARWGTGSWDHDDWEAELRRLRERYFPDRTERVIAQFKKAGLLKTTAIPTFSIPGGSVPRGERLGLHRSIFAVADLFYTTDGTDPRAPGGDVAPQAIRYSDPLTLTESLTIRMRTLQPQNEDLPWSPLVEATFLVGTVAPNPDHLRITKIHYHPTAPSPTETQAGFLRRGDFEFLELSNVSAHSVHLGDLLFTDGIAFDFAEASITELAPGESLLLVRHSEAFSLRYGLGRPVAGTYMGGLANSGEALRLETRSGDVLLDFSFDDKAPWPETTDGEGAYLVLRAEAASQDFSSPEVWRANRGDDQPGAWSGHESGYARWKRQHFPHGPSGDLDDPDGDGAANLLEYAVGSDPHLASSKPDLTIQRSGDDVIYRYSEQSAMSPEVSVHLEFSQDLEHWTSMSRLIPEPDQLDPTTGILWRTLRAEMLDNHPTFARLQATKQ